MKSGWGLRLMLAGLTLALAGGYLVWRGLRHGPLPAGNMPGVTEIRDTMPLPAFALDGPQGRFTNANLAGRWSFLFFGYTQCPDICPTALNLMKEVKATLASSVAVPSAPTLQVVFVSVDPRRDTRELLAQYMAAFDAAFVGISGDDAALAPLIGKLGAFYQRNDRTEQQRYTVDHSAAIYLIDPQGRLAAVFPAPQQAQKMAADFRRIAGR